MFHKFNLPIELFGSKLLAVAVFGLRLRSQCQCR
jgi:hypothetical protein